MREADAVELVERAELKQLEDVSAEVVYRHVDYLGRALPGPIDLYQRWERQQWSATALDFGQDGQQWAAIHPDVRERLEMTFSGFFFGEQAVTDTLSPLVMGAPDEDQRLFLATQVVDEARHSYFFARFYHEVLGVAGGLKEAVARVAPADNGSGYSRIFNPQHGELATSTDAVRLDPRNYGLWVQALTVYHLMVEGQLALTGQRSTLRLLRELDLLPAFRAGFTAVTRDESRHVSFGVWALREAVRAGHEGDIRAVVDRMLEPCMQVYSNPAVRMPDPRLLPPAGRQDPEENWSFAIDSVTKRLRTAEVSPEYVADVDRRAWDLVWANVAEYERRHGGEHPFRIWRRGEVEAAPAAG